MTMRTSGPTPVRLRPAPCDEVQCGWYTRRYTTQPRGVSETRQSLNLSSERWRAQEDLNPRTRIRSPRGGARNPISERTFVRTCPPRCDEIQGGWCPGWCPQLSSLGVTAGSTARSWKARAADASPAAGPLEAFGGRLILRRSDPMQCLEAYAVCGRYLLHQLTS